MAEPGGFSELSPELSELHRLVSGGGGSLRILSMPLLLGFWGLLKASVLCFYREQTGGKGLSQP